MWQCSEPCHQKTYDNEETVLRMMREQHDMRIPPELIPRCPVCKKPMTMNLRCDNSFVEDEGWRQASQRYAEFLRRHEGMRTLHMELGVGGNTPAIIKYPFWRMTKQNPNATYACVNIGKTDVPGEISERSVCIDGDIGKVIRDVLTPSSQNNI